jgi:hypothetical protein
MRNILFLIPFVALAGCATEPSLESRMAAYTGASAQTLVQQLGVPDKQITVKGVQYFAYDQHHYDISGGYGVAGFGGGFYGGPFLNGPYFGGPIFAADVPPTVNELSCETTFMLKHDKVFDFTLRGNDCG